MKKLLFFIFVCPITTIFSADKTSSTHASVPNEEQKLAAVNALALLLENPPSSPDERFYQKKDEAIAAVVSLGAASAITASGESLLEIASKKCMFATARTLVQGGAIPTPRSFSDLAACGVWQYQAHQKTKMDLLAAQEKIMTHLEKEQ